MRSDGVLPPLMVGVLGPLQVAVHGAAVDIAGAKRRAVLALLALVEGAPVSVDDLVDAVWGGDPPERARAAVHTHIFRVRGQLGALASRLESLENAYRLRLVDGELDVHRARALIDEARSLLPEDPASAQRCMRDARELWRGRPLSELADFIPIASRAVALEELRHQVDDLLIESAIGAGDAASALGIAAEAVAAEPLREGAVMLLARALDAAGRAPEALRASHEYRRRLRDETGLDPSPRLAELERTIASGAGSSGHALPPPAVPVPVTPLVGREPELAALSRLVESDRLVTVVGPGGVGKTRLAVEAARRHDDVHFLALAPVTDAAAIPRALAAALRLDVSGGDVLAACAGLLAAGPHLLVVDNCEHLLAPARDVVATLLATCPELTVVATSREPLGIPAECQLRLGPLPLPDPRSPTPERAPAVAVFLDRARRARPGLLPGYEELRVVTEIVRQLDGLPLAIELAAGRLASVGLTDLRDRLGRANDLLAGGRSTPDARHNTLRATWRWSYGLLPAAEQRLFRHVAVFPDGIDLATAEMVGEELEMGEEAATAISHLVDASMLEADLGAWPRYRLLRSLRIFALEQLDAEGERPQAEDRLLRWALALARWTDATAQSEDEPLVNGRLRQELPNLRTAWQLARARHDMDTAVELVVSLCWPSIWRDLTEVWEWAAELGADPAVERHPRAAAALAAASECRWNQGELQDAQRLADRALRLAGDDDGRSRALSAAAAVELARGRYDEAARAGLEAAALSPLTIHTRLLAALAAAYGGDLSRATSIVSEANPRAPSLRAQQAYVWAECARISGRYGDAERHYREAIELGGSVEATFVVGIASLGLAVVHAETERPEQALRGYRDLLEYWEQAGNWIQVWTTLRNLAVLLGRLGDRRRGAFLQSAADRAPEAPAVSDAAWYAGSVAPSAGHVTGATAESISRAEALDTARCAITDALGGLTS